MPDSVLPPDTVETAQLGTLRFFDGMPDSATVQKVYDNLDFLRGVEAFLNPLHRPSPFPICSHSKDDRPAPIVGSQSGERPENYHHIYSKGSGHQVFATHAGMTQAAFQAIATDWLTTAQHPQLQQLFRV